MFENFSDSAQAKKMRCVGRTGENKAAFKRVKLDAEERSAAYVSVRFRLSVIPLEPANECAKFRFHFSLVTMVFQKNLAEVPRGTIPVGLLALLTYRLCDALR